MVYDSVTTSPDISNAVENATCRVSCGAYDAERVGIHQSTVCEGVHDCLLIAQTGSESSIFDGEDADLSHGTRTGHLAARQHSVVRAGSLDRDNAHTATGGKVDRSAVEVRAIRDDLKSR